MEEVIFILTGHDQRISIRDTKDYYKKKRSNSINT
jgi:hypothetical protein